MTASEQAAMAAARQPLLLISQLHRGGKSENNFPGGASDWLSRRARNAPPRIFAQLAIAHFLRHAPPRPACRRPGGAAMALGLIQLLMIGMVRCVSTLCALRSRVCAYLRWLCLVFGARPRPAW